MQPFSNRFMRLVPDVETTGVFASAQPLTAQHSAGVPLLRPVASPQTLPRTADFTRDGQTAPTAYFMIGRDLFVATSNQILRDIRTATAIPTASPFLYAEGIFDRLRAAAMQRNPAITLPALPVEPIDASTQVSDDWLKVALWLAYSDAPVRLQTVRLPLQVLSPTLGGEDWTLPGAASSSSVQVSRDFDPTLLAQNTFATYVQEEIPVEGLPGQRRELDSNSSNGAVLVGLGLVALLLIGSNK